MIYVLTYPETIWERIKFHIRGTVPTVLCGEIRQGPGVVECVTGEDSCITIPMNRVMQITWESGYKNAFEQAQKVFKRSRIKVFSSDQTQAVSVFKMLDKFPKGLSSQAKDIYITAEACKADKEKSVKYGKVFTSAATHQLGGFGSSKRDTIVKWNSNKSPLTEDVLAHELAHSLDCSDGQYGYSSSSEYKEAFNKDGNKFVTPYAKKSYDVYNNDKYDKVMLFVEDFAEAIKLYVTDPNFSTSYPNRAKYFNKIIKR